MWGSSAKRAVSGVTGIGGLRWTQLTERPQPTRIGQRVRAATEMPPTRWLIYYGTANPDWYRWREPVPRPATVALLAGRCSNEVSLPVTVLSRSTLFLSLDTSNRFQQTRLMSDSSQVPELEQVTDTSPEASFSVFEMAVLVLAVLSVFLWPGLYGASEATTRILELSDYAVSAIFLVKFVLDLLKAPSKRRFMRWGWIDLIASIPVLPVLHGLRLFRIVRLFRQAKVLHTKSAVLQHLTARRAEATFSLIILVMLVSMGAGSLLILNLEDEAGNITTPEEAIWWAFVTVTTVGYGDYYPVTTWGRLVAALLSVCGIGMFGVFTGWVATFLLDPLRDANRSTESNTLGDSEA